MREYATPLEERIRLARYHRERCERDPAYRLKNVNRIRAWRGLPLLDCPSQIGSRAEAARLKAAVQQREASGRFA